MKPINETPFAPRLFKWLKMQCIIIKIYEKKYTASSITNQRDSLIYNQCITLPKKEHTH